MLSSHISFIGIIGELTNQAIKEKGQLLKDGYVAFKEQNYFEIFPVPTYAGGVTRGVRISIEGVLTKNWDIHAIHENGILLTTDKNFVLLHRNQLGCYRIILTSDHESFSVNGNLPKDETLILHNGSNILVFRDCHTLGKYPLERFGDGQEYRPYKTKYKTSTIHFCRGEVLAYSQDNFLIKRSFIEKNPKYREAWNPYYKFIVRSRIELCRPNPKPNGNPLICIQSMPEENIEIKDPYISRKTNRIAIAENQILNLAYSSTEDWCQIPRYQFSIQIWDIKNLTAYKKQQFTAKIPEDHSYFSYGETRHIHYLPNSTLLVAVINKYNHPQVLDLHYQLYNFATETTYPCETLTASPPERWSDVRYDTDTLPNGWLAVSTILFDYKTQATQNSKKYFALVNDKNKLIDNLIYAATNLNTDLIKIVISYAYIEAEIKGVPALEEVTDSILKPGRASIKKLCAPGGHGLFAEKERVVSTSKKESVVKCTL